MRGYGSNQFSSLERIQGLGEYYVASEVNSLKVFRIQPLSITEFKGDEKQLKADPNATKSPPRKEPFEIKPFLLVYSTFQLNTLEVFLKLQDVEVRSTSYGYLVFVAFGVLALLYIISKYRAFKQAKKSRRKKKIAINLNKENVVQAVQKPSKELLALKIVTEKLLNRVEDNERKQRLSNFLQSQGEDCIGKMRESNSIDPFSFMKDADHLDKELKKKELHDSVILREFFSEKFEDPGDSDHDKTGSTQSGFRKRFSMLRKNTHKRSI